MNKVNKTLIILSSCNINPKSIINRKRVKD